MADKGGTSENVRKREIANSFPENGNASMSQNSSENGPTPAPTHQQYSTMKEYYESLQNWVFMYKTHTFIQQQMMMTMPYVACASYMQQQTPAGSGVTGAPNFGGAVNEQRVPGPGVVHPQQAQAAAAQQVPYVAGLMNGPQIQNQQNAVPAQNNIPQIPGSVMIMT